MEIISLYILFQTLKFEIEFQRIFASYYFTSTTAENNH